MMDTQTLVPTAAQPEHLSTLEVARILGLAVRSVQLMVDRGELQAWKTPGGHRRIDRKSVEQWQNGRREGADYSPVVAPAVPVSTGVPSRRITDASDKTKVLLIEDSLHYQNLVGLLAAAKLSASPTAHHG